MFHRDKIRAEEELVDLRNQFQARTNAWEGEREDLQNQVKYYYGKDRIPAAHVKQLTKRSLHLLWGHCTRKRGPTRHL